MPQLQNIILMKGETSDDPTVLTWSDFLDRGGSVSSDIPRERMDALRPDQLATLIYTSGTTGFPKAVMLSHRNLTWTASTAIDMFNITQEDSSLSYLPLSHIAEQMFTIHGPIIAGWRIDFAESQEKVAENLREIQPTILFGVPRVWEKVYAAIYARLLEVKGIKNGLLTWARSVAEKVHTVKNKGLKPGPGLGFQYGLTQKLVFSKLKGAIGLGNARFCVSGAAPIAAHILEFFASLDIPIMEVYGQSEGSGPTTFNRLGKARYGSVGPPFPNVEIKIEKDGEILLRGNNVFLGYFKDEKATDETLIDGWLYSGDLGKFDEDGFLWITGRKKDIIVTSGGKNISPTYIEGLLSNVGLIEQSVVIGDQRKYLTVLITLNQNALEAVVKEKGLPEENLHENEIIRKLIQEGISGVNSKLTRVENIQKFRLLPRLLDQENGELTPTLKLIRQATYENWSELIEEMYREDE